MQGLRPGSLHRSREASELAGGQASLGRHRSPLPFVRAMVGSRQRTSASSPLPAGRSPPLHPCLCAASTRAMAAAILLLLLACMRTTKTREDHLAGNARSWMCSPEMRHELLPGDVHGGAHRRCAWRSSPRALLAVAPRHELLAHGGARHELLATNSSLMEVLASCARPPRRRCTRGHGTGGRCSLNASMW